MYFNQEEFGKRIREERKRIGLTQEEFARPLNIGYTHENNLEKGRRGCSIDLLLEMSAMFGVTTDYLLLGENPDQKKVKDKLMEISGELDALIRSF